MSSDTLLSTKLRRPDARPAEVARPRLMSRLAAGLRLGRRLTLVSAPPGFGKTTLIREWAAAVERRIAWLTLDEGDNDPERFVRYLVGSLDPDGAADDAGSPVTPQQRLISLINGLAAAGDETLLVLDDYQEIRSFAVHDLVVFLLAHQPSSLHLVIGTREDPPLPLPRLPRGIRSQRCGPAICVSRPKKRRVFSTERCG